VRKPALLLAALAALAPIAARSSPPVPPPAVRAEARKLLADLVAIDTTQSGSTAPAVELLASHLRGAGFSDADLLIVGPRAERQNLVVRWRGPEHAQRKPILFLSHLDVVAADARDWSVPPFQLTERDGWLYGRGTLDIKGEVVDLVVSLARLARAGFRPTRDLVLALTADEEEGDANGVAWLLANRRDLFDVAYVVNTDAGGLQEERGRLVQMPVQVSEKLYLSFRLSSSGPRGHSAFPTRENAISRLARALARLDGLEFPVALNSTTRATFERLAAQQGELAAAFRGMLAEPPEPAAIETLSALPFYNASLRTVCTPTLLSGGTAENALPEHATATIQCRLLPDADPARVRETIVARIADPQVEVTPLGDATPAPESPRDPELFGAVEAATRACWPGVPVVPVMDMWASDGAQLRGAGIPVYGVSGISFDVNDVRSHGSDERIAIRAFEQGLEFMHRLMQALAGPPTHS
jgi:acetylornithine deacetylase/succinyl-diaminopimelate desuccinylase-like protein